MLEERELCDAGFALGMAASAPLPGNDPSCDHEVTAVYYEQIDAITAHLMRCSGSARIFVSPPVTNGWEPPAVPAYPSMTRCVTIRRLPPYPHHAPFRFFHPGTALPHRHPVC